MVLPASLEQIGAPAWMPPPPVPRLDSSGLSQMQRGLGGDLSGVRDMPKRLGDVGGMSENWRRDLFAWDPAFRADPAGYNPFFAMVSDMDAYLRRTYPEMFAWEQGGSGDGMASPGGEWANVDQWDQFVRQAAAATGVPANLIKAVMKLESGGVQTAVSVAGAQGLMQVMPFWFQNEGIPQSQWQDPATNILMGAKVLKVGFDRYGDWDMAIRSYLGFGTDALGTTDTAYLQRVKADWNYLNSLTTNWSSGATGQATNVSSGAWANFNGAANQYINQAAARHGVPANLIKSMIMRESSGNWARDGSRVVGLRGDQILPYVGIFRSTATSWGYNFDQMIGNQAMQIDAMARGLRLWYDNTYQGQPVGPTWGWPGVVSIYFSGRPQPIGWRDENGLSDSYYLDQTMEGWRYLDSLGGGGAYGGLNATGGGALATIWGGGSPPGSLAYGFNAPNNLGYYDYGRGYGMDGRGHTGLDIPMPLNSPYYAPVAGTVTCAGTGIGPGTNGGGCGAFGDVMGRGAGRVEIVTDQGHVIIFGHSSTSALPVGSRVQAGQMLGTVGGMNGAHIHLEVRIPDSGQTSGWRIVDPEAYFGGGAGASPFGGPGGGMMPSAPQLSEGERFLAVMRGDRPPGTAFAPF